MKCQNEFIWTKMVGQIVLPVTNIVKQHQCYPSIFVCFVETDFVISFYQQHKNNINYYYDNDNDNNDDDDILLLMLMIKMMMIMLMMTLMKMMMIMLMIMSC